MSNETIEKEMRKVFSDTLLDILSNNNEIVALDADLASSSGMLEAFNKFPKQCVNAGISEQNMIGVSAGLSLVGLKPIVHSFAPFVTRRVLDQIYTSIAYGRNNIFIYASDPGYWSQYNGGTHTTFEDFAMLRTIPEMTVFAPSDSQSLAFMMRYYAKHGGAVYCRTPRSFMRTIYESAECFAFGQFKKLGTGKDILFIAAGDTTSDVFYQVIPMLANNDIHAAVIDLLFVKPQKTEELLQEIKNYSHVISVENHNVLGGIGDMVAAMIAEHCLKCKFLKIGVHDRFGEVGDKGFLKKELGLDPVSIFNKAEVFYTE